MILQFKNCYILLQPRKSAVPLAFPFFLYIPSPPSVVSLTRFLITNSKSLWHTQRMPSGFHFWIGHFQLFRQTCFHRVQPPLSACRYQERRLFRFNPVVFLVALRVKIVPSHTPVSLLITFDFTFYIIVFFLCTCQVVTLIKYSVFFDMICVQTLYLHNPFSVFLYRLRANKSSRFRMRFVLSSSSFVAFSSCCSPLMLWAA